MLFARRTFLRAAAGLTSALALPGVGRGAATKARACIVVFLQGGPSHLDTFDPKPGASMAAARTAAMSTSVPGIEIAQGLPGLARRAAHYTLIRSLHGAEKDHARAQYVAHTSHRPQLGARHAPVGALVGRRGGGALPGYVVVGGEGPDPGLLGAAAAAFEIKNPLRRQAHWRPHRQVTPQDAAQRLDRLRLREEHFAAATGNPGVFERRKVLERAVAMTHSDQVSALDLERESAKTRARYGDNRLGQSCLLARRAVEAGVPFVEVVSRGWDTHRDHDVRMAAQKAELDRALSALLDDLRSSGLERDTLLLCLGEFGRTPARNAHGGRDHHSQAFSALAFGSSIGGGAVVGATDENGGAVVSQAISLAELTAGAAVSLGVDPVEAFTSDEGRPVAALSSPLDLSTLLAR